MYVLREHAVYSKGPIFCFLLPGKGERSKATKNGCCLSSNQALATTTTARLPSSSRLARVQSVSFKAHLSWLTSSPRPFIDRTGSRAKKLGFLSQLLVRARDIETGACSCPLLPPQLPPLHASILF